MRTSEEIYHRIRWDARFDPARFVLGVDVHRAEPKRIAFSAFVPGGDVPWHRVLFIEADGELVWDRREGVDRLDESTAGHVRAPQRLRPPFFTARRPHRWDAAAGRWAPAEAGARASARGAGAPLRVLTWNTLWDRYDADRIASARRRPLLLEALQRADADVLALQEVEPALLALLLDAAWVRRAYTISDAPAGRDVETCGLLLLSRLPVLEAGWHALGPYKAAVALTLALDAEALVVAAVHLTSDHALDGALKREAELAELAAGLGAVEGELLVLGDFNDGSAGPAAALGLRDAWTEVHGASDGTPTFDPGVNPLAAISSLSGRASRLDRVLLRGEALRATGARLEGSAPATSDGLFVSDHFGVRVELAPDAAAGEALDATPTARTAVAWIPPADLWPPLQELRQRHDPAFERWPPPLNVLFGFVPEALFEAAAPLLSEAAAEVGPFEATLEGVREFEHSADATVWLDPAAGDAASWARLHAALTQRFPRCRGRAQGYTPHLTLGRLATPGDVLDAWSARLGRTEARVGELALLSRRGGEPMQVRATLELGSGTLRWRAEQQEPDGTPPAQGSSARTQDRSSRRSGSSSQAQVGAQIPQSSSSMRQVGAQIPQSSPDERRRLPPTGQDAGAASVGALVERLQAALPEAALHVTGSRRLGCALDGADLDLVAALPGAVELDAVEARVREALPHVRGLRRVLAVRVPGLEFRAGGLDVDLTLVGTGSVPAAEAVERRGELDEAAAAALSAVSDAETLLEAMGERREEFRTLARVVKAWARARGLDAAPFGGLPGLAWLVLAARTVREADALEPDALLLQFFCTWAAWDWAQPVALWPEAPAVGGEEDAVRIATPSAPVRSCSDALGAAGRAALAEELYAGWEVLESGAGLAELFAPPPLHRRHAAWAVLAVEAGEPDELAAALGWVRGRVRALLAALERAGVEDVRAWPRPFERGPSSVRLAIGLGQRPPDAAALERVAGPWAAALRGVRVAWAEGGALPTLC